MESSQFQPAGHYQDLHTSANILFSACRIFSSPFVRCIFFSSMLPFHSQERSISDFLCSLTRNITSHSMKNLAFHSLLRWKMIILPILTTSLIHFSVNVCENACFLSLRVEGLKRSLRFAVCKKKKKKERENIVRFGINK